MKKALAILLTLGLIATLSVASFAAEVTAVPGSENADLGVNYTDLVGSDNIVYSIDVAWDSDMTFDYKAGNQGAWDPDNHAYGATTGAEWTDDEVVVTVTNHSNAALKAAVTVEDKVSDDGVTFVVDKSGKQDLATAVNTAVTNPPKVEFTISPAANAVPTKGSAVAATATVSITVD